MGSVDATISAGDSWEYIHRNNEYIHQGEDDSGGGSCYSGPDSEPLSLPSPDGHGNRDFSAHSTFSDLSLVEPEHKDPPHPCPKSTDLPYVAAGFVHAIESISLALRFYSLGRRSSRMAVQADGAEKDPETALSSLSSAVAKMHAMLRSGELVDGENDLCADSYVMIRETNRELLSWTEESAFAGMVAFVRGLEEKMDRYGLMDGEDDGSDYSNDIPWDDDGRVYHFNNQGSECVAFKGRGSRYTVSSFTEYSSERSSSEVSTSSKHNIAVEDVEVVVDSLWETTHDHGGARVAQD